MTELETRPGRKTLQKGPWSTVEKVSGEVIRVRAILLVHAATIDTGRRRPSSKNHRDLAPGQIIPASSRCTGIPRLQLKVIEAQSRGPCPSRSFKIERYFREIKAGRGREGEDGCRHWAGEGVGADMFT